MKDFLETVFLHEGLVLHGGTPVAKRREIVERFQQSGQYVPFIVLSIKAGGVGLNLTNANHVIHFDRWWNPAVENQATDRAFRIGQRFIPGPERNRVRLQLSRLCHNVQACCGGPLRDGYKV